MLSNKMLYKQIKLIKLEHKNKVMKTEKLNIKLIE